MAVDAPTASQIRIMALATIPIAILVTWFRLFLRAKKRKLWWDDFFASIAMVGICFLWTGILIFTSPPESHTRKVKIFGYYCVDNGFYATIWPARISILLTVVRLATGQFRRLLTYMVGAFLVTWAILDAQVWWTCERQQGWKDQPIVQCMLGRNVAIAQLITDCFADLILIIAPIWLLSTLTTMRGLRIRLMVVFSSTIFTTIFSLVHAYAILHDLGFMEFMFAVVEIVVSLIVVNLTVISSWIFRLTDDDDNHGPYLNTFLRGERPSPRRRKSHGATTFGLSTFTPAHIEITTEVDTAAEHKSIGHGVRVTLPTASSEELDDSKTVNKKSDPYAP
ncbi:hypothetical protein D9758_010161 [Tetrapyrgos nigripes]|uniref:Rhodopsin domain-containing protein n=1 Tax=Tetrapyrgos nigripes TaxID=182062 RepID=A0A8H5CSR8_9AGAR|nr:hypothetical protein D9758_010161 [Tetrapyrgos nigripes]